MGLLKVREFGGKLDAKQGLPEGMGHLLKAKTCPEQSGRFSLGRLLTDQLCLWEKKDRNLLLSGSPGHPRR